AFTEFQGAYQMINQQFLLHHAAAFQYVNREDDAGDAGLRKAKLSYHPAFLQEKYIAVDKSNP
ncbi:MAG: phosphatidylglycerol lysyltransferase domain-containing protein, partial [Prevotellaceae bacterium]|nr:phosphatidylglycerol lysyltransferase domain-containing protein [Prevotellaceae bacterium]